MTSAALEGGTAPFAASFGIADAPSSYSDESAGEAIEICVQPFDGRPARHTAARHHALVVTCTSALTALISGLTCMCLYANDVSIAWSLVCLASSTGLAVHAYSIGVLQSMPSLPRCLALLLAGAWLATALMASLALIARLCMAPSNVDDVWDAIFSLATCLVLGTMITWLRNRVVLARYEAGAPKRSAMRCARNRSCGRPCCCCFDPFCSRVLAAVGVLSLLIVVATVFDAGASLSEQAARRGPALEFAYVSSPSRAAVHYWCQGVVRNDTIAIFEGGYMLPDPGLDWVQRDLSARYTRVCLFDRPGTGYSQRQTHVGFVADADAMRGILDREFSRFGRRDAPAGSRPPRRVIVGGHSRGFLSAATFHARHANAFDKVLVVSLDGSWCERTTEDVMAYYAVSAPIATRVLAPVISLLAGFLRAAWPIMQDVTLTGGEFDHEPPSEIQLPPPTLPHGAEAGFRARFLRANYWRRAAFSSLSWWHHYDGPNHTACGTLQASGELLEVHAAATCVGRDLQRVHAPCASSVCRCAGHVELVTNDVFAKLAAEDIERFVQGLAQQR